LYGVCVAMMASIPTPEQQYTDGKNLENFLKIEDGASQPVNRMESNRAYFGTYKRWMWGSVIALCCLAPAVAFIGAHSEPAFGHGKVHSAFMAARSPAKSPTALHGYVPDGLSKEQWEKMQKDEKAKRAKKNFGAGGARGFESRSFNSFVAAQERGEAGHLFPVNPDKVRSGEIALKDVPYMQRGGSWTNNDLRNKGKGWMKTGFGMTAFNDGKAAKMKENKWDKKYNDVKPNIGIFDNMGLDWTGKGNGQDSVAKRAAKNGISQDQQMWRDAGALTKEQAMKRGNAPKVSFNGKTEEKKGFFGWR